MKITYLLCFLLLLRELVEIFTKLARSENVKQKQKAARGSEIPKRISNCHEQITEASAKSAVPAVLAE